MWDVGWYSIVSGMITLQTCLNLYTYYGKESHPSVDTIIFYR